MWMRYVFNSNPFLSVRHGWFHWHMGRVGPEGARVRASLRPADSGLHRSSLLRSEVFGGGDQRLEPLQGGGQPTPPPTAFNPEQEVAPREPPLHPCVDFDAACCMSIG